MKFNNMKSLIPVAAFTLMIGFSSCVGDLDVKPINPQQTMTWIKMLFLTRYMQVSV